MKIWQWLKRIWQIYDRGARSQLTEAAEYELDELEHIFGLLVLGSFVGLPSPPMQISLDLLPDMEKEMMLMLEKTETAAAPLSDLASIFEVG